MKQCICLLIWQAVGNQKDDPVLAEFHISIENQLTQVEGRILETPKVSISCCCCCCCCLCVCVRERERGSVKDCLFST